MDSDDRVCPSVSSLSAPAERKKMRKCPVPNCTYERRTCHGSLQDGRRKTTVSGICHAFGSKSRSDRTSNVERHLDKMHSVRGKPMKCCETNFYTKQDLQRHRKEAHFNGFECDVCGKKSNTKHHHTLHMGMHLPANNRRCEFCTYSTSRKPNLERHRKSVHFKKQAKASFTGSSCSSSISSTPSTAAASPALATDPYSSGFFSQSQPVFAFMGSSFAYANDNTAGLMLLADTAINEDQSRMSFGSWGASSDGGAGSWNCGVPSAYSSSGFVADMSELGDSNAASAFSGSGDTTDYRMAIACRVCGERFATPMQMLKHKLIDGCPRI